MTAGRRQSDRSGEEQQKPMQTRPPPMAAAARKRTMERYATVVVELAQAAVLPDCRGGFQHGGHPVLRSSRITRSHLRQQKHSGMPNSHDCKQTTIKNHEATRECKTTLHGNRNLQENGIIRLQSILSCTNGRQHSDSGFTSLQTKSVHFKLCLAGIVTQGRIIYLCFRD